MQGRLISHIQATVVGMIARGAKLRDTIEGRFALASKRLPCRGENLDELRRLHALIDGETARGAQDELRLQVFTNGVTRQIHFEIAQCAGLKGLSEGSLRTLFEGTELDQKRRGILRDTSAARASL